MVTFGMRIRGIPEPGEVIAEVCVACDQQIGTEAYVEAVRDLADEDAETVWYHQRCDVEPPPRYVEQAAVL